MSFNTPSEDPKNIHVDWSLDSAHAAKKRGEIPNMTLYPLTEVANDVKSSVSNKIELLSEEEAKNKYPNLNTYYKPNPEKHWSKVA